MVDGTVTAGLQRADEIIDAPDVVVELRRADADEAHEMRVAAAERVIAEAADQLGDPIVLALAASSVERLDRDHALERRLGRVVRAEPDVRSAGMTRQRDAAETLHLRHDPLRGQ